ncbi:DUF3833 domain-containing protein [Idiomarina seosinensis]|uniref:DUF3833 domain-containing protein n=1 Tax=Idiomarina seosinensis TaxID=281739 RepID=UPI00384B858B
MAILRWFTGALFSVLFLVGCSTSIDDYQGRTPQLKLEEFFNGSLVAYGTVQDYSDDVIQRFRVEMQGSWDGNEGELAETFYYADGSTQERTWYLTKTGPNTYEGRADDVEGVAVGTTAGNALNWQYVLQVEMDGDTMNLSLDDWMYLVDQDNMINRTTMSKFGVNVGEITLYIGRK